MPCRRLRAASALALDIVSAGDHYMMRSVVDSTATVRIMSWNLWWRFGPAWRDRQRGILGTIRSSRADVIAVQETWAAGSTSQVTELGAALNMYSFYGGPSYPAVPDPPETPDQAGVQLGLGLLSRWPFRSVQAVGMPAAHRTEPPVLLLAVIGHPAGPLPVIVCCLEVWAQHNDDRFAQARMVAAVASATGLDGPCPVIVAGDLNAAPTSPVLEPIQATLTDAWSSGGGDPREVTLSSAHPFAAVEVTELIDQRIDHIFVRGGHRDQIITCTNAATAGDPVDGLDPSDHRAVICDITWTAEGQTQP
jgi:endonuclease/exonuclease/phosphatase family metal-dependent hydrolase